jgi:hypothetical protein
LEDQHRSPASKSYCIPISYKCTIV